MKKKWLLTTAMLAAIAGVSGALMSSGFPSANAATAGTTVTAVDNSDGDGEVPDAQEKAQAQDPGKADQETADDQGKADQETADDQGKAGAELSDAQENAKLAPLAKITKDEAVKTALVQVKGTVKETHLEDENGTVIYNVAIVDDKQQTTEVKIDATTGKFLKAESDSADENGSDGQENQDSQDNGADGENAND